MTKVLVTGMGIVSALGIGVEINLAHLKAEKSGIDSYKLFKPFIPYDLPIGEIPHSNKQLGELLGLKSSKDFSRTSLLGLLAAREAYVESSNPKLKTGLVSSTTVGGMDQSEIFYQDFLPDNEAGSLRTILMHDCGESSEQIARNLGIKGLVTTINTACSSAANAAIFGARLLKAGKLDRVLIGGVDAITNFTMGGFNALGILNAEYCKPFDKNRNGLNLGEGSAFLMLETEAAAKENNSEVFCELSGYGNANDAYHQTASSPEGSGAALAMQRAIEFAQISPADVEYINAHGTGTGNNDLTEGLAIKTVFGENIPKFSSTKGYTGHCLAASGSLEAVFSILSMNQNFWLPNLNFKEPIEEHGLIPIQKLIEAEGPKTILSNSFGFGGNCTSLIFKK